MANSKRINPYSLFEKLYIKEIDGLLELEKPLRIKALVSYSLFYVVLGAFGFTSVTHFLSGTILYATFALIFLTIICSLFPVSYILLNPKKVRNHKRVYIATLILSTLIGMIYGFMIGVSEDQSSSFDAQVNPNSNGVYYMIVWGFSLLLFQFGLRIYNQLTKSLFTRMQSKQSELDLAREIQTRFLPSIDTKDEQIHIIGCAALASEIGGDYFDAIKTEKGWILAIGDVSGHGMAAGLLMTSVRSAFRTEVKHKTPVTDILHELNLFILEHAQRKLFMTFAIVEIDFQTNEIHFANAGHLPTLVKNTSNEILRIKPKGVGLGISTKALFHKETLPLPFIQSLLLITDGLLEGRNAVGEEFGIERVESILKKNNDLISINESIKDDYKKFTGEQERKDDETLLLVKLI